MTSLGLVDAHNGRRNIVSCLVEKGAQVMDKASQATDAVVTSGAVWKAMSRASSFEFQIAVK